MLTVLFLPLAVGKMAELVALRTFIKLKVLESIPETGSISLRDLAQATGAQESLLGTYLSPPRRERKYRDKKE
jgi:hypothetical protein